MLYYVRNKVRKEGDQIFSRLSQLLYVPKSLEREGVKSNSGYPQFWLSMTLETNNILIMTMNCDLKVLFLEARHPAGCWSNQLSSQL